VRCPFFTDSWSSLFMTRSIGTCTGMPYIFHYAVRRISLRGEEEIAHLQPSHLLKQRRTCLQVPRVHITQNGRLRIRATLALGPRGLVVILGRRV
jgi:hypothetical protein